VSKGRPPQPDDGKTLKFCGSFLTIARSFLDRAADIRELAIRVMLCCHWLGELQR